MVQKYCTICWAVLSEGVKFCENCGAAVEKIPTAYAPSHVPTAPFTAAPPKGTKPKGTLPAKIIAGIVIALVLLVGAVYIFVIPIFSGSYILAILT
jgi:hypothetical protein